MRLNCRPRIARSPRESESGLLRCLREKLVAKLAEIEEGDAAALAYELEMEKKRLDAEWLAHRPEVPPTMYLLLGPPLSPSFRLEDLAVDRDLIGSEEPIEPLPPLPD